MHRYVASYNLHPCHSEYVLTDLWIETQGQQEEHHQLPPDENVPQGRRPQEEGGHPRLKYGLMLRVFVISGEASRQIHL